jgi:hypothetical protein
MKHDTIRNLFPTPMASAAHGVAKLDCYKTTPNAFGVRLFWA